MHLTRRVRFSAAHHFAVASLPKDERERLFGDGARTLGHGHDYMLEATVRGGIDPRSGMVMNVKELKERLLAVGLRGISGRMLNDEVEELRDRVPTLENLIRVLWSRLGQAGWPPGVHLARLTLHENEGLFAEYEGKDDGSMRLTRVYDFCASHRLHSAALSDVENERVFGKCNHPNGHGHNYVVEITVEGAPDPRTGQLVPLGELDVVVDREVLQPFDHKNLNVDLPEFATENPTAENIARAIWRRLEANLPAGRLHRVRLVETPRNLADYYGD
jgi:6-pyruvoyltetrahydropterin/6-carboxytetrahydropterin synthase